MTSSLETKDPGALDALNEAIRQVIAYRQNPANRRPLDVASDRIKSALQRDPKYLRAVYYAAIVDDLIGKPAEAAPKYEQVLNDARADSTFLQEVRYNLGVAYYHGYRWLSLDKAIKEFNRVLGETRDPSLTILALAGRAQAYAMHMIPPEPTKPDKALLVDYSRLCKADFAAVLAPSRRAWRFVTLGKSEASAKKAATWAAHNASGMRRMYLSDYWDTLNDGERRVSGESRMSVVPNILSRALDDLHKAETVRPRDWANWCDLASAHLRLGRIDPKNADGNFVKAEQYLREVTETLRPNYGFALYELGRVNRLWSRFDEAEKFLNLSSAIPGKEREVGDLRVQLELARARAKSTEYP